MSVTPHILRRYVIDRAAGRSPHPEWSWLNPDLGAWILADETTARQHVHHRRIRREGVPWCDFLGHRTAVHDDRELQVYFETIPDDEWSRLAIAVMRHPQRSLQDWRASGARIIAAVSGTPSVSGTGALSGWPKERGTGPRSMLPR